MKRILSLIAIVAVLVSAMVSCDLLFGSVAGEGDVTVVVEAADGSYEVYKTYLESVENKSEGAKGVIEHLNQGKDKLHLVMVDSTYGAYVSEIGSIKQNEANSEYVIIYTSVASDSYEGAPSIDYDGTTLYSSGVGLSGMTVEPGTVILFRIVKY